MKISKTHYETFMAILTELNEHTPLLLDNVEHVIHEKLHMRFPKDGMSASIKILPDDTTMKLFPYSAIVSVTARDNHLSKDEPLLEFKIFDPPGPKMKFNTWLSVFPNNRIIFQTHGMTLDSIAEMTSFNSKNLQLECFIYRPSITIDNLSCHLINMVPLGGSAINEKVKSEAITIFQKKTASMN